MHEAEVQRYVLEMDDVDTMSNFALCELASSFDFGYGTHKELSEGVDEFYKDSMNLSVRVQVALQRVRDALAAKHPRGRAAVIG